MHTINPGWKNQKVLTLKSVRIPEVNMAQGAHIVTNHRAKVLDPYFMNIIPESLFPIGGMVILIALLAWWGSERIYNSLERIGATDVTAIEVQEKKDS